MKKKKTRAFFVDFITKNDLCVGERSLFFFFL